VSLRCNAYGFGSHPGGSNFFLENYFFKENFPKIRVKVRVILGKGRGKGEVEERGEAIYN